jgi:hypothetical protein
MTIIGAQPCQFNEGNTDLVALVNRTCSECRQLGLSDACSSFNAQPHRPATPILPPNSPMGVSQVRQGSLGSAVQEVFDRFGGREGKLL